MPYVNLVQERIYYARQGPRETAGKQNEHDRAIVLIHAAGGSHLDWPPELRRMPGVQIYAIDLVGHGRSSGKSRLTIDSYVQDLQAFMEVVVQEKVVMIGQSMGGAIVQSFALQNPDELHGQVLINTGPTLEVPVEIKAALDLDHQKLVDILIEYLWSDNTPEKVKELGRKRLNLMKAELLRRDYAVCNRFDITDRLTEITIPTLILCGSDDRISPPSSSQRLATIPGSRIKIIKNGGHMLPLEQPKAVAAAIQEFLKEGIIVS